VVRRGGVRMSNFRDEYIGESCAALLLTLLVGIACFYVCGRDHTVLCGIGHRQEMGGSELASKRFTR
jgi:hypothetical protein